MNYYKYRAVGNKGKSIKGRIAAEDTSDARLKLADKGLIPIKIEKSSDIREQIKSLIRPRIKVAYLAIFCRQLYLVVKSGANILKGLDILRKQKDDKENSMFVDMLYQEVQKGRSLSQALEDSEYRVPILMTNMMAMGEKSGKMDQNLLSMAVYYEKEGYIKSKIRGAMVYPALMLCVSLALIAFFMSYVMPEIMKILQESAGELPDITRYVIGTVDFIKAYILHMLIAVAAVVTMIKVFVPKATLRIITSKVIMKIPVINISVKKIITSRFLRNVAIMLKAGVPIIDTLESVEKIVGDATVEKILSNSIEKVKRGEKLANTLSEEGYFDSIVTQMMSVGEETGQLDTIMDTMADYYDRESEVRLMKLMSLMEPLMIVILGSFMGILIVAMVLPMFGMMDTLGGE